MAPKRKLMRRGKSVSLVCFGLGSELISLNAGTSGVATLRTFVLDRLPSRLSWFPLYEQALVELNRATAGSNVQELLQTSRSLRGSFEAALAKCVDEGEDVDSRFPLDREWRAHSRDLLRAWRALELVYLDKKASLRELTMEYANYLLSFEGPEHLAESHLGFFERGEALMLQGRFSEASANFKNLIVGAAGRLRRFYELLAELCVTCDSPDSPQWKERVTSLAVYVVKENVKEYRLVELLMGKIPALVKYFLSDDASVWGGRSWPRLLAAVLNFHDPGAKRHVLPHLAERCAAPFGVPNNTDAVLAAFQGEAMKAMQLVYNHEPLGEAILWEILSRAGALESPSLTGAEEPAFTVDPWELDIRQVLWCNLSFSLALGPGRVWERSVDDDGALSLKTALEFLTCARLEARAKRLHRRLLIDRTYLATSRSARRLLLSALTEEEKIGLVANQLSPLQGHDTLGSCHWAALEPTLSTRLVENAVAHYLDRRPGASRDADLLNVEDPGWTLDTRVVLKLRRAKELLDAESNYSKALELVSECVDFLPIRNRRQVLCRALGLDLPLTDSMPAVTASSATCLKLLHVISLSAPNQTATGDEELRAVLGLMFCEAMKREASAS